MPSKDLDAATMLSLEGCTLEWISSKSSTAVTRKLFVGDLDRIAHANWCTDANGNAKLENTARIIRDNPSWVAKRADADDAIMLNDSLDIALVRKEKALADKRIRKIAEVEGEASDVEQFADDDPPPQPPRHRPRQSVGDCVICYNPIRCVHVIIPCCHAFCADCVSRIVERGDACPMCRGRVASSAPVYF